MKKGRPQIHKEQNRISVTLSDEASAILALVKGGKKSQMISDLIVGFAPMFPTLFVKPETKSEQQLLRQLQRPKKPA